MKIVAMIVGGVVLFYVVGMAFTVVLHASGRLKDRDDDW